MTIDAIAEAFSGHRFADAYPFLADGVRWELVGGPTLIGPDEVRAACDATLRELEGTETEFRRFRTIVGRDSVVVDAVGVYRDPDGSDSTVASCDIFDFSDGRIVAITSYTVELPDTDRAVVAPNGSAQPA